MSVEDGSFGAQLGDTWLEMQRGPDSEAVVTPSQEEMEEWLDSYFQTIPWQTMSTEEKHEFHHTILQRDFVSYVLSVLAEHKATGDLSYPRNDYK